MIYYYYCYVLRFGWLIVDFGFCFWFVTCLLVVWVELWLVAVLWVFVWLFVLISGVALSCCLLDGFVFVVWLVVYLLTCLLLMF